MTWPPPPPASDPWATGSAPDDAASRDDGTDPVDQHPVDQHTVDQHPAESVSGPVDDPFRNPAAEAEPISQPVSEADPMAGRDDHAALLDAGHPAEPHHAPPPPPADDRVPAPPVTGYPPATHARHPDESAWSAPYHPPPVIPRAQVAPPKNPLPIRLIAAAVAVAVIVLLGVGIWLLLPSGDDDGATAADTTTASPTRTADPQAQERLSNILPRGYSAGVCEMGSPPDGALAVATCGPNTDPGGPPSATYTVAGDDTALDAAFNAVIENSSMVNCPGNIQSPGPWRRNATPQKVSGVLYCGLQNDRPVVAWTNTDESLIAVVKGGPQGPGLDQLYTWWSSHS
ncbi:hypothetical protein E4P42_23580 [Mycobacterium sp. PS03-16]|uniref:hypothetical protein n=1 Tax=Mycobacterium sp. PS03-16 TaxID=2559611 RepID=UPI0010741E9D|nr:hypothetical protein [Mycobacterium sp. PS03-16]TFV55230.1 hypothetical protein E4P42_23580 [Mycobacterium sp. PS03-16]